ncbi:MAG: TRAP transporter substrate-binding protein [Saprospiraceae bacterium]|nr:TRAP transporter substrate-binding protein [Saprospiraceae bacterium]
MSKKKSNGPLIGRKTFFKGIALGTISLPLALRAFMGKNYAQSETGAPALQTSRRYRWKMVTTWPPNFPVLGEACQLFADRVDQLSGGRLQIRVYGAGELVPALESFDAVRSGAADMGSGAAYYWAGKAPAAQFFASVPFGMNAQQLTSWIVEGGGMDLWRELYADFGLVPFLGGNTGVQMGGWFNREINSVADLKGLTMRIPGLGGKVLEKAGGAPVLLAGGEIYTGLERGVIDATEWLGPYHDYIMGFHEIARYYYSPGWHEPGTALEFFLNKSRYDQLPADLQAIVEAVSLYVHTWCLSAIEARNAEYLEKLIEEDIDIRTFPIEVLDQLRLYTEEVIADLTSNDPFTARVYASYDAFRQRAARYADITEEVFYDRIQAT